jgi:MFS family permease
MPWGSRPLDAVSIEDPGLTAFYKDVTPPERRTFRACLAGTTLEGLGFMISPLVIGMIIALWWMAGFIADRIGRVLTLQITTFGRAVGSVQSGCTIGWGHAVIPQAILFSLLRDSERYRCSSCIISVETSKILKY